jgi:predicted N-formylglutamate amidohydrolase
MPSLLNENEKCSYTSLSYTEIAPIFLTCDHASNTIPKNLKNLELPSSIINSHRGWDIGALDVSLKISKKLHAPLCYTNYSRLVIDCNRPMNVDDAIPEMIDGYKIPNNTNLSEEEYKSRINEIFRPYHQEIKKQLEKQLKQFPDTVYLAIHSFTPTLGGEIRPWDIGVTYCNASKFSDFILKELELIERLKIGVNQPYPITIEGDYGIQEHGEKLGLDSLLLEIRQDRIDNPEKSSYISNILIGILKKYLNQSGY